MNEPKTISVTPDAITARKVSMSYCRKHNQEFKTYCLGCAIEPDSELAAPAGYAPPEVMREYLRLTAPPKAFMDAVRMQVHQLEMTMLCGGPSEICGAIDAVESALHELRELVTPNSELTDPAHKTP